MSYQVLARKWRPRNFAELVGQEHVTQALSNALNNDRVHQAYLFAGTRGVGKTTIARILVKCLNCETGVTATPCGVCQTCREVDEGRYMDLIEVDAASRAKVDETRELMENVQYAPVRGRYKVYLIDEVHMFSGHSFNALLKTLEEPPPHVKFLLATTEPKKLPVTVLSRCLQFQLRRLPANQMTAHLCHILDTENVSAEAAAVDLIAEAADGSMRDALSLMDQAIAYGGGALEEIQIRAMLGIVGKKQIHALIERIVAADGVGMLAAVEELAAEVPDFSQVLSSMSAELQRIAILQQIPEAYPEEGQREALLALAVGTAAEDVQLYYQIALAGQRDLLLMGEPRRGFEMVLLRMLAFRPEEGVVMASLPAKSAISAPKLTTVAGGQETVPPKPTQPALKNSPEVSSGESDWQELLEKLELRGITRELALNSVLLRREGMVFHFCVDRTHAQLLNDRSQQALEVALSAHFKQAMKVHFESGNAANASPAGHSRQVAESRQASAEQAIRTDPKVQALCEAFDAEVAEQSIRAPESPES